MDKLTRRQTLGLLTAGSLGWVAGCTSVSSTATPINQRTTFTGDLDYADGRFWLKQSSSLPNPNAFIFDTGAGNSSIWRNEADYILREKREIPVSSFGDTIIRKQVDLAPIPLGQNFSIPTHNGLTAAINHLAVSDVLVGINAFAGHTIELNVPNGQYKIRQGSPNPTDYEGFTKKDIFRYGPVYVRVSDSQFRSRRVRGNIDTGSRRTVLPRKFLDRFDLMNTATELGPKTIQLTSSGKISPAQYVKIGQLNILGHTFEDYWCLALLDDTDLGSADFYVGADIMSEFDWAMDLDSSRALYAKRTVAPTQPPPLNIFRDKQMLSAKGNWWLIDKFDPVAGDIDRLEGVFDKLSPQRVLKVEGVDFDAPAAAYEYAKLLDDSSRPFTVTIDTPNGTRVETLERQSLT